MTVKGKRVSVIGAARSGLAAARELARRGAHVLVSESRPASKCRKERASLPAHVETEFGGHTAEILRSEIIVASPGVHPDLPIVVRALKAGIPVVSELEMAWRLLESDGIPQHTVAITGTNGKTTTTVLAGEILRRAGRSVCVAGNIGRPLIGEISRFSRRTNLVLEVSSFQLHWTDRFHPDISAILNLTNDHLPWHGSFAAYRADKAKVFANQRRGDVCIINRRDAACRWYAQRCMTKVLWFGRRPAGSPGGLPDGVWFEDGRFRFQRNGKSGYASPKMLIPGEHNIENALAAAACCRAAGVSPKIIADAISRFRGVEHRIENVAVIGGVSYVNDSKATNVDSTMVALRAVPGPMVLILGGRHKGVPYKPLLPLIRRKVKAVVAIGESRNIVKKDIGGACAVMVIGSFRDGLLAARRMAVPGDTVLLSPACASFDQFDNFEHRGKVFKEMVRGFKK